MTRTDKRLRLCILLLIANLTFIWGNSLLPAETSRAISDWLQGILSGLFSGDAGGAAGGSGLLRKLAHFAEFCGLGLCLGWLFGMLKRNMLRPFLWGVAAACVDETIQLFVPERGPGILAVCIDAAGVAAGIGLLLFGYDLINRVKQSIQSGGKSK